MDESARFLQIALELLTSLSAISASARADNVEVQKLLGGLKNPTGVAIRPDSTPAEANTKPAELPAQYDVVVCESGGGRIVAVRSDRPNESSELVTGFPELLETRGSSTSADPDTAVGLFFLDNHRAVVGSGDLRNPTLRLYDVGGKDLPVAADSPTQGVQLPRSKRASRPAVASGYSLARTSTNDQVADSLIVSSSNAVNGGSLWKVIIRADTLEKAGLVVQEDSDGPASYSASTVSPSGFLVAAEVGESGKDSHLVFLNPIDASVAMRSPLDLPGVVALAYSPRSANLYAAAAGASGREQGGIYRLDGTGQSGLPAVKAVKVAEVDRPGGLAFGSDGALYVTSRGADAARFRDSGVLLKFKGEL